MTQREAARYLQRSGLAWSHQYVAAIERGRRQQVSLHDLVILSWAFRVPVSRWFAGDGDLRLSDAHTMTRDGVRSIFRAGVPGVRHELSPEGVSDLLESWSATSAEQHVAHRLTDRLGVDVSADAVAETARRQWGRSLDEERDARIGNTSGLDKSSLRAKRTMETRRMLGELEALIGGGRKS